MTCERQVLKAGRDADGGSVDASGSRALCVFGKMFLWELSQLEGLASTTFYHG